VGSVLGFQRRVSRFSGQRYLQGTRETEGGRPGRYWERNTTDWPEQELFISYCYCRCLALITYRVCVFSHLGHNWGLFCLLITRLR
jgi:hypothetical protein